MSILTAESIIVGTANSTNNGFLGTGRTRTLVTIQESGLNTLAFQCGCNKEDIDVVIMILKHSVNGAIEVMRFNKFGNEEFFTGTMDGAYDDLEGTYEEQTRIVYISGSSNKYFYKDATPAIVDPESFVFLKEDETGEVTLDAGSFNDPETSEPPIDGGSFNDTGVTRSLDGGEF